MADVASQVAVHFGHQSLIRAPSGTRPGDNVHPSGHEFHDRLDIEKPRRPDCDPGHAPTLPDVFEGVQVGDQADLLHDPRGGGFHLV